MGTSNWDLNFYIYTKQKAYKPHEADEKMKLRCQM